MKRLIRAVTVGALAVGLQLSVAPAVLAVPGTTTRADESVDIWCDSDPTNLDATGPGSITPGDSAPEGGAEDDVLAKRVDARAIQPEKDPGGKDTATAALQRDGRCSSGMVLRRGLSSTRATAPSRPFLTDARNRSAVEVGAATFPA